MTDKKKSGGILGLVQTNGAADIADIAVKQYRHRFPGPREPYRGHDPDSRPLPTPSTDP